MKKYPAIYEARKNGDEVFETGEENSPNLGDFWRWAYSRLLTNVARGVLAEFLVANALGIIDKPFIRNEEWDPYDLKTKEGTKVEVKSAAYIQTWGQDNLSRISFNIARKKKWIKETGKWSEEAPKRNCDVYVFCLLTETDQNKIDPPWDISHWKFYVVSSYKLDKKFDDQKSISLSVLKGLHSKKSIPYDKLEQVVERAKRQVASS